MKKIILCILITLMFQHLKAQVNVLSGDFKVIDMGGNGYGDYTRSLILLHEIYNGTVINHNYAVGTITAMRGHTSAFNRYNAVLVNTSSAYGNVAGTITAHDDDINNTTWKLKTCLYQGRKYLAVEVPYSDAYHDRGFKFTGSTTSTGENMKCVSYQVNGQPVNQNLISDIQDFNSGMVETHTVARLNITGNVGIGTSDTEGYKLAVAGNMIAESIKVKLQGTWPDYVFNKDYLLPTLEEAEKHIKEKGHLPGIPSVADVKINGVNLGEMDVRLLQKIEELTLYMIEFKKKNEELSKELNEVKRQLKPKVAISSRNRKTY